MFSTEGKTENQIYTEIQDMIRNAGDSEEQYKAVIDDCRGFLISDLTRKAHVLDIKASGAIGNLNSLLCVSVFISSAKNEQRLYEMSQSIERIGAESKALFDVKETIKGGDYVTAEDMLAAIEIALHPTSIRF